MLNSDMALEIYKCKAPYKNSLSNASSCQINEPGKRGESLPISRKFGVSPKTIRDIWSRRTWVHATNLLWLEEDDGIGDTGYINLILR